MQENSGLKKDTLYLLYFLKLIILLQVMKAFKIGTGERYYKALAKAAEKC